MKIIKFIKRIYKEYPKRFPFTLCIMLGTGLSESIGISIMVPLLNLIQSNKLAETNSNKIAYYFLLLMNKIKVSVNIENILIIIFIVFLIQSGFRFVQYIMLANLHTDVQKRLTNDLYQTYFKASWPFFYKNNTGYLINCMALETTRAGAAVQLAIMVLGEAVILLFYGFILIYVSWQLTISSFLIAIIASLALKGLMRRAYIYGDKISDINNKIQSEIGDKIGLARIIKATATEEKAGHSLFDLVNKKMMYRFKSLVSAAFVPVIFVPLIIGILCMCIYISLNYLKIEFSLIMLFIFLFYRIHPRVQQIQGYYHQMLVSLPALEAIDAVLTKARAYEEPDGNIEIEAFNSQIELNDVCFSYNDEQPDLFALKKINLTIKKGQMVAIVGGSGSGKSTIIDLLLGLQVPNKGEVKIDNSNLLELKKKSWRNKIGYVSQDIYLLNDSIINNITWKKEDASSEEIKLAVKLAYADEFIEGLEKGYETLVGDRGVKLSGGQKQRIALARAILQNPDILILDEATSSLDAESEHKILEAIEQLAMRMTIIIVSHRLAAVKQAGYIYVLEKGEIFEQGTWGELIENKSRFQQLRNLQLLE